MIFTSDDRSITNLIYASPLGKSLDSVNYLIKCGLNHDKIHYLYHAASFNSMKNDHRFIDWPRISDSCYTVSCWERFLNTINPIISKYTSTQKPNSSKKRSIWMTKDILSKLKLKNRSYHRYLKTDDQQDSKTYAKHKNQSKRACRKAIAEYEKSFSGEVKTNPKAFLNIRRASRIIHEPFLIWKMVIKLLVIIVKEQNKLICFSQVYLWKKRIHYQNLQ